MPFTIYLCRLCGGTRGKMIAVVFTGIWLIALSLFDMRYRRVPVWLILPGGVLTGGVIIYQYVIEKSGAAECWFGMIPGIALLLLAMGTRKAGWADGMVTMFLGGILGLRQCIMAVMLSLMLISVLSLLLLIFHRANRGTKVPFIPFLTLGFVLCEMVGG